MRTNELSRALAAVAITELVERTMLLGLHWIDTLASGFLAGGVLLGQTARPHFSDLQQSGFDLFNLSFESYGLHSSLYHGTIQIAAYGY